jgi:hypothetical protein
VQRDTAAWAVGSYRQGRAQGAEGASGLVACGVSSFASKSRPCGAKSQSGDFVVAGGGVSEIEAAAAPTFFIGGRFFGRLRQATSRGWCEISTAVTNTSVSAWDWQELKAYDGPGRWLLS